jgi:hypothetical protein
MNWKPTQMRARNTIARTTHLLDGNNCRRRPALGMSRIGRRRKSARPPADARRQTLSPARRFSPRRIPPGGHAA